MRLPAALLLAILWAAGAAAHPPYGLVADRSGNVYFSDLEAVWRLTPRGRLELFRPAGEGFHVHEVALAPDGAVEGDVNHYDAASQVFSGGLWRRTPDGRERWLVAPTPAPPRGLGTFSDARGNRYTSHWASSDDRRTMLFRRAPDGRVELLYGPREEAGRLREALVSSIGGMAATLDGGMVFADGRALRRVSPAGEVTTLHEAPEGAGFRGVSVAPDGRVIAADFAGKAVIAVAPGTGAELLYRETEAWLPTAALVLGRRLLVLEANADHSEYEDRVRVIEVVGGRAREVARLARRPAPPAPDEGAAESAGFGWRLATALALAAAAIIASARWRRLRG
jgi:hypothetical protein